MRLSRRDNLKKLSLDRLHAEEYSVRHNGYVRMFYLSPSDGEVGEYTVLLVFMSGVGFQALSFTVIPQL